MSDFLTCRSTALTMCCSSTSTNNQLIQRVRIRTKKAKPIHNRLVVMMNAWKTERPQKLVYNKKKLNNPHIAFAFDFVAKTNLPMNQQRVEEVRQYTTWAQVYLYRNVFTVMSIVWRHVARTILKSLQWFTRAIRQKFDIRLCIVFIDLVRHELKIFFSSSRDALCSLYILRVIGNRLKITEGWKWWSYLFAQPIYTFSSEFNC